MARRRLSAASFVALLALVHAPAQGGVLTAPRVLNLPTAPFQLAAVPERSSTPPGMEHLTGVEFIVKNTGTSGLTRIAVQATVFTAAGNPRGYFSFEVPVALKPGRSTYAAHATDRFRVDATDHVVLLPLAADGLVRWTLPEEQLRALGRELVAVHGDVAATSLADTIQSMAGPNLPQQQNPDPGDSDGCTACNNAPTTCKSFCAPCFPGGYTCACQPVNISCTCGKCPG